MPIYRVLAAPGSVIYVFDAAHDEEAERFARQLSRHSQAGDPRIEAGCAQLERHVEDDWRRVCAFVPGC
jgi:hypothetical protein